MLHSFALFLALLPSISLASPIVEPRDQSLGRTVALLITRRSGLVQRADGSLNTEWLSQRRAVTARKIREATRNVARNEMSSGTATRRAPTASEPIVNSLNGSLWYTTISIGTPPQDFTVMLDTGSSDTFIPQVGCTIGTCLEHKLWDPTQSSTAVDAQTSFALGFGDGSGAQGEIFKDTVSIAGLTAFNQDIGAATHYTREFDTSSFEPDGLMGLGFQDIGKFKSPPLFQTLIAQGQVTEPVFAIRHTVDGGEINLGGINPALAAGPFTFVNLTTVGFWQTTLDGVMINGQSVVGAHDCIIDNGEPGIIGEDAAVEAFYATIPGSAPVTDPQLQCPGCFTIPCDGIPTVSLVFGGTSFTMSPNSFIFFALDDGSNLCVGAIQAGNSVGEGIWVIGDAFLLNTYAVFDVGNTRVGFAPGA